MGLTDVDSPRVVGEPNVFRAKSIQAVAVSPDQRFLIQANGDQTMTVYRIDREKQYVVCHLSVDGDDWVIWHVSGRYAASQGMEQRLGWLVWDETKTRPKFHRIQEYREAFYRPDVFKLAFKIGNVVNAAAQLKLAPVPDVQKLELGVKLKDVQDANLPELRFTVEANSTADNKLVALRVFLDGKAWSNPAGLLELKEPSTTATFKVVIKLPPGRHEVKVLARGVESSEMSESRVFDAPQAMADQPNLYILPVGVKKYQNAALDLRFPDKDARDMANAFRTHCVGPKNLFQSVVGEPIVNEQATHDAVLNAIRTARDAVRPQDMFILFFSGHGVKEGPEFYLLTHEADLTPNADGRADRLPKTAISGAVLQDELQKFPCQVLLILDACYATQAVAAFRPAIDDSTRQRMTNESVGVSILSASRANEKSDETGENGHLTAAFVKGLEAKDPRVTFNVDDRRQYIHHLFAFTFDEVVRTSKQKQHPFLHLPWTVTPFPLRMIPK